MTTKRFTLLFLILFIFFGHAQVSHAQSPDFQEFQSIATNGAYDWEFFTIGSNHYLAVANRLNGSTYNIDSKIYQWNGQ